MIGATIHIASMERNDLFIFFGFNRSLSSNQSVNRKHTHKQALKCVQKAISNEHYTSKPMQSVRIHNAFGFFLILSVCDFPSSDRPKYNCNNSMLNKNDLNICMHAKHMCFWISIRHFVFLWLLLKYFIVFCSFFSTSFVGLMEFLCLRTQKWVKEKKVVGKQIIIEQTTKRLPPRRRAKDA